MRKIIYTRHDGGLSVVTPAINTYPQREEITEAEAEQRAWDKLPADAINPKFVDASTIPADRSFRNAWKDGGGKVDHDIAKCREIAHTKRRRDRAEVFKPLDIEATIPAKAAQAEAKRQQIRDKDALRQAAIDAASTVEELKALL